MNSLAGELSRPLEDVVEESVRYVKGNSTYGKMEERRVRTNLLRPDEID